MHCERRLFDFDFDLLIFLILAGHWGDLKDTFISQALTHNISIRDTSSNDLME